MAEWVHNDLFLHKLVQDKQGVHRKHKMSILGRKMGDNLCVHEVSRKWRCNPLDAVLILCLLPAGLPVFHNFIVVVTLAHLFPALSGHIK